MNTYEKEQLFTDKYGDYLMKQVANSFYNEPIIKRITDKNEQIEGIDYEFWKKPNGKRSKIEKADIKLDYYDNNNFCFELDQQYTGIGEKSWIEHDGDIWIIYFKIARKKCYIYKLQDLKDYRYTIRFADRKIFETNRKVDGKPGHFKNFRLDELPVHHIVDISLDTLKNDAYKNDSLLETKISWPDKDLYMEN